MAFPTASVLDNFNRANANPDGSGSWTSLFNNIQILSNEAKGTSTSNVVYWNAGTFNANCETYVTLGGTLPGGGGYVEVGARVNLSPLNGYAVRAAKVDAGTDVIQLSRIDNSVATSLATYNQEISSGDSIGIECNGSTIKAYYKASGGSWTEVISVTDSTYGSGGRASLAIISSVATVDNYGGGDIVGGTTYNITADVAFSSSTPDISAGITRGLSVDAAFGSSTPDVVGAVGRFIAVNAALESSTPDIAAGIQRAIAVDVGFVSATPDIDVTVTGEINLTAAVTFDSSTPDIAANILRALAGDAGITSSTPDIAGAVTRPLTADVLFQSITPDITVATALIVGAIHMGFSAKQPGVTFSATQPGMVFTARQPHITFTVEE